MADTTARISGLETLIRQQAGRGRPPVDSWHPPYCGDIGLRIRADAVWEYRGSPINRASLVKLFASVLRKDADGQHYLVTPAEKVDVAVDDAPFLAAGREERGRDCAEGLMFGTRLDDLRAGVTVY